MKRATYRYSYALKAEGDLKFAIEMPVRSEFCDAELVYGQSSLVAGLTNAPLMPIFNLIFAYDPDDTSKRSLEYQIIPGGAVVDLPDGAVYLATVYEPPVNGQHRNPILIYQIGRGEVTL